MKSCLYINRPHAVWSRNRIWEMILAFLTNSLQFEGSLIDARWKWSLFCIQHFRTHFLALKASCLGSIFIKDCFQQTSTLIHVMAWRISHYLKQWSLSSLNIYVPLRKEEIRFIQCHSNRPAEVRDACWRFYDDVIEWKHSPRSCPLRGKFIGQRWIPLTKASDADLWWFLWSAPEQTLKQTIETPVIRDAIAFIMPSL